MPLYTWEDKTSGKQVEIIRHFNDYEKPPEQEDCKQHTPEEFSKAVWVRVVSGGQSMRRGANWGYGSKGNW